MRSHALLLGLALAGCTVGPDYAPPKTAVPVTYAEPVLTVATPADLAAWWHGFGDQELDRLVAIALADSLDIRTAASRVRQARLAEIQARAAGLPTVDATGNVTHLELSKNAGISSLASQFGGGAGGAGGGGTGDGAGGQQGGGLTVPGGGITTYAVGFDASWEIDLFGGVRRQREAAAARTDAAVWSARDAAVTLAAEVASNYFQLRQLQAQEAVLRADIARAARGLELQQHQSQVGLIPSGDTIRQRAEIAGTQARLEPLLAEERIRIHALGLLLAKPPADLTPELGFARRDPPAPPPVPPGLPSDLLRQRPDIRSAERRLAAATADIGVAVADLYPRFSLTGMAELVSTTLRNLLSTDSFQSTTVAGLSVPLLDFGRRRAEVGVREEDREQAYLDYQRTVLAALRDVEDALARLSSEQARNGTLRAGVADAGRATRAVEARYTTGLIDLSAVLDARATELQQRDLLAQSEGALRSDLASLYKALGGGWSDTQPTIPPRGEKAPVR